MARNTKVSNPTESSSLPLVADTVATSPSDKVSYYRIKRISSHIAEILEVEVDEAKNPPKRIGKQDLPVIIQDRIMPLLYPSVDDIEKKRKLAERAAKEAAGR
jgi:hypothetical protein